MNPKTRRQNLWLPAVLGLVIVAATAALIVTVVGGSTDDDAASDFDTTVSSAEGGRLPLLAADDDAAVGDKAPLIEGTTLTGQELTVPASGRPTVLMFLAHWCPHCRAEVPVVQEWLDEGNLPDGVDLVGVSTAMNPERPNYPASSWLIQERWTAPTIADATGVAAQAYGLSAFPFWVAIDARGDVVARTTGELTKQQIDSLVQAAMTTATTTQGVRPAPAPTTAGPMVP